MTKDSNEDIDHLEETIKKAKKDISKGLLSGFNKLKKNIEIGLVDSNIQQHINDGDMEQISESSKVFGKAAAKGAVEGISELATAISSSGNALFNALNKSKKQEKKEFNDDEFDEYEIIDED